MFGAICANRPVQTNLQILSPTQFTFQIPAYPTFSHIVVFLLPGQVLPDGTAAGVYIRFPPSIIRRRRQGRSQGVVNTDVRRTGAPDDADATETQKEEGFKFLGAIGNEKQSAVFRVRLFDDDDNGDSISGGRGGLEDEDAMVDEGSVSQLGVLYGGLGVTGSDRIEASRAEEDMIILGISIESVENISAQLAALQPKPSTTITSMALVPANAARQAPSVSSATQGQYELRLARKIITNAFNFLASFAIHVNLPSTGGGSSTPGVPMGHQFGPQNFGDPGPGHGGGGGGRAEVTEEVIPLRAFRDWWTKFETKIELDPSFLNRDE